jgi:glycosyltransferase involved in cell wall biosynthesis
VEVIECQESLWHSIEDRVQAVKQSWKQPAFWWRVARTYGRLLRRYWQIGRGYDILIVGYPGQFDIFLARLLSWWRGKPLVWDIFMSIYLIALERGLAHKSSGMVDLLRRVERLACRLPDRLILDTDAYIQWFCQTHDLLPERFRLVPTGADSDHFQMSAAAADPAPPWRVVYYGTFIPNHGVDYIVEAARQLVDDPRIQIELIGSGPDQASAQAKAQSYQLPNVTFIDWLDQATLIQRVQTATLCLGAFGTTPQSLMTIQNKIYEGLALGKVVLTGDSPVVQRVFAHGRELYLCERANPTALASAIRTLCGDAQLRATLAQQGHARFCQEFTIEQLGAKFKQHLCVLSL